MADHPDGAVVPVACELAASAHADAQAVQIDLHRLELRFANARIVDGAAVQRLANSIHEYGQLVACIAAPEPGNAALVLIDGYRRVGALARLGRDTALVQCWGCPVGQALAQMLARSMSRAFAPIEEALMLRELIDSCGLSQREAAQQCARDVSWVSRRLVLLGELPQDLAQAVRTAQISSWAATRIFAPLARANTAHASALLHGVQANRLSTRELHIWFEHYQRAQREHMAHHPRLFIDSLNERDRQREAVHLRDAAERELVGELGYLQSLLARVRSTGSCNSNAPTQRSRFWAHCTRPSNTACSTSRGSRRWCSAMWRATSSRSRAMTTTSKRSGNPSVISALNLRISWLINQRTRRGEHGSRTRAAMPGGGGGVPGLWPKEQGVGCGQRCSPAGAGELVRALAALAGAA